MLTEQDRKNIAEFGRRGVEACKRFKQEIECIYGGQRMTRKPITQKEYKERLADMTRRFDEVEHCHENEAKVALDKLLAALGIEVEKAIPIQDQRWIPVDCEDGYEIHAYDSIGQGKPREVGLVFESEDKDFVLGAQQLVNIVVRHILLNKSHHGLLDALKYMNVEVKE